MFCAEIGKDKDIVPRKTNVCFGNVSFTYSTSALIDRLFYIPNTFGSLKCLEEALSATVIMGIICSKNINFLIRETS